MTGSRRKGCEFVLVWKKIGQEDFPGVETTHARLEESMLEGVRLKILERLPPREEAERLSGAARETAFFVINHVLRRDEISQIIRNAYNGRHDNLSTIDISLLFIILGTGAHVGQSLFEASSIKGGNDVKEEGYLFTSQAAMTLHGLISEGEVSGTQDFPILKYHDLLMNASALLEMDSQQRHQTKDAIDILVALVQKRKLNMTRPYEDEEDHDRNYFCHEVLNAVGEICLVLDYSLPMSFCERRRISKNTTCSRHN